MDGLLDSSKVRDFIELKISYKDTGFNKIVKKYVDDSGDSLLENIIFYNIDQYNIYIDGINYFLENKNKEEYQNYLMVLRGLLVNSVRLENELYYKDIFDIFMEVNKIYNILLEGKSVDDVIIASKKVILHLSTLMKKAGETNA